jgi:predicted lactoylglutathione lyase
MRLTAVRFRGFINGEIIDAARTQEVLTRLSAGSSEQVDERSRRPSQRAGSRGTRQWTDARCTAETSRTLMVTSEN